MKTEMRVDIFVKVIILVVLFSLILGFNGDKLINWLIPFGISFILTGIAGDFLENLTGDFFKKFYLSFKIFGREFSVTTFMILTLLIKYLLFK